MKIARRVRVTGRVQGVFFRAWTREQAQQLGVSGWVRNCADGSVEAQFEGDGDAVKRIIDALQEGPPAARVDKMDVSEAETEDRNSFEVRH